MDTNCYERQHGGDLEVGSYAHRAILMDADDIPSIAESKLSPTELPFTEEDFELQMEQALELVPDILGDERVGIRHQINGLLSLTPDGMPILGETPEVKGLWAAAAVWIKEAPGIARMVAEWMTDGKPEIDPHGSDIARFHAHQKARHHVKARSAEGFNKTYGIVHPAEQWASNRNVRLSPFNPRERELGAVFFETAGWERPFWYESNKGLLEEYGDRVMPRDAEWESRWWSPIINAEHLAMRDRVGMVDLSAFAIFDITGPGALDHVQRDGRRADGRAGRPGRLHAAAQRGRRHQVGPDDHAARARPLPGRDRRRPRHGRPQVVQRPPAGRRLRPAVRRDVDLVHGRDLGSAGTRRRRVGDLGRRVERGLPVRDVPDDRARRDPRPRLAHLVRRRARLGAVRADGAGRAAVGHALRRRASRTASSRSGSASTARPGGSRRATAPTAPSSSSNSTSSRPTCSGPKVKEADFIGRDGLPRAALDGRPSRRCARSRSTTTPRPAASSATCSGASRS